MPVSTIAATGVLTQRSRSHFSSHPVHFLFGIILCIVVPAAFFISFGLVYLSALLFGGRGSYLKHNYTFASFQIPLAIITVSLGAFVAIFSLPASIAQVISILVKIYGVWLLVLALRAVHALNTFKATMAAILPAVVIAVVLYFLLPAITGNLVSSPA